MKAKIAAAAEVKQERRERLHLLGSVLDARRTFIPTLLQAQAQAMVATRRYGEEIVLRKVAEVRPGAVRVEAWALSESGVQRFTRELAQQVRGLDLRVKDHEMREGAGPYGLPGFAFGFVLVPDGVGKGAIE